MLDNGPPAQAVPRALVRVGGSTLAQHQLGVARALKCQRVVCFARGTSPDLIALQHDAERAGMKFRILRDAHALSAIVTARDELLIISEGLLVDAESAAEAVNGKLGVLVQPAQGAVDAGFERIDADHAAAGISLVAGQLVEQLHDLPPDVDVPSALMRVALQRGSSRREVPPELRAGVRWRMIASETEADAIEDPWLRHALGAVLYRTPGFLAAYLAARLLGPLLLQSGNAARVAALAGLFVFAIAVGLGWFGLSAPAFIACAIAWLSVELVGAFGKIASKISSASSPASARAKWLGWLCDIVIALQIALVWPLAPQIGLMAMIFAPVMFVLLLRIASRIFSKLASGWVMDRALLCIGLAIAAIAGIIPPLVQVLTLALAFAAIATPQVARD